MISYADALKLLSEKALLFKGAVETVKLDESLGRKTASEIESPTTLPAFDTAAVDGFAIRSSETLEASSEMPLKFEILGSLSPGDQPLLPSKNGVYEIATGAPFPEGYDACVRQEDVVRFGDKITLTMPVAKNQNRREAGEDFRQGSRVLKTGHTIRAEDILCLAALGVQELQVYRKPRVALISSGREFVDSSQSPVGAQIRNATTPYLKQTLKNQNVHVFDSVQDNEQKLMEIIERAHEFDLIVTTGSISTGKYNFVTAAFEKRGMQAYFKKVRIAPGHNVMFGRLGEGAFVVGLPGSPVAATVGMRFFVDPLLKAMKRDAPEVPQKAKLARTTGKMKDMTSFLKASLRGDVVEAHENQQSSITHALLHSNAWIVVDAHSTDEISEGTIVDVYPFNVSE